MDSIQNNIKNLKIKFSLLSATYWLFHSYFLGYILSYMIDCGVSDATANFLCAGFFITAFIGMYFWGRICDKTKSNKKIFIIEMICSVIYGLFIIFLARVNVKIAVIFYSLIGFFTSPLITNIDAWMLQLFQNDTTGAYGKCRAFGSVGNAVGMLTAGKMIELLGYNTIPISTVILGITSCLIAIIIPEAGYISAKKEKQVSISLLFIIKPYILLCVIVFFVIFSCAPINNTKIIMMRSVGGDVTEVGIDSFLGILMSSIIMFCSSFFIKIDKNIRILIGTIASFLTLLLAFFGKTPLSIMAGTIIYNSGYYLLLLSMRETVEKNVPSDIRNTAHNLMDGISGSLSSFMAMIYSGIVLNKYGVKTILGIGLVISIIPLVLSSINVIVIKSKGILQK